jgi:HSP20 family protein
MRSGLILWRPFEDLEDLRRRMDRMFEELTGELPAETAWAPAVDVHRDDGKLVVRADVPGFKPDEIKVELEGTTLTVSGAHEETGEEKKPDFLRRERRSGAFRRSISLPPDVDAEAVEAVTHDGVLEVTLPLPEHELEARKVITPKPA